MQRSDSAPSRVRFESVYCESARDGSCNVSVQLEWQGEKYRATKAGVETQQGILTATTQAALAATLSVAGGDIDLRLGGVKAVRAFDGWVVIVRLNRGDQQSQSGPRLLGAAPCETDDELPNAAVQAVLDATNRVLARASE